MEGGGNTAKSSTYPAESSDMCIHLRKKRRWEDHRKAYKERWIQSCHCYPHFYSFWSHVDQVCWMGSQCKESPYRRTKTNEQEVPQMRYRVWSIGIEFSFPFLRKKKGDKPDPVLWFSIMSAFLCDHSN